MIVLHWNVCYNLLQDSSALSRISSHGCDSLRDIVETVAPDVEKGQTLCNLLKISHGQYQQLLSPTW